MIVYDVKFPQSSGKITSATNTYTITKQYYPFETTYETITDDILNEIKTKGKYTSKAKSGENGSLMDLQEVSNGLISQLIYVELIFRRTFFYNGYYVFSSGGFINPQDHFSNFIKNGKITSEIKITNNGETEIPLATSNEMLDDFIAKGYPIIAKDFIYRIENEENQKLPFAIDFYISPTITFEPKAYLSFDYEAETYHLESYSAQQIQITGENIDYLGIVFSGNGYSYPNTITTDIKNQISVKPQDDTVFFKDLGGLDYIYLSFEEWNLPNSEISFSFFTNEININRANLISVESNLSYRADKKLPSFGILSNTGNLEFNDIDGRVRFLADNNLLKSGVQVELFLRNTLTNTQEQVGKLYTGVWDYDNDNRKVSVPLKDDLEEWQDITPSIPKELIYDPRTSTPRTLQEIYIDFYHITPEKYNLLRIDELDTRTQNKLLNTIIQYPLVEESTLWQLWTKFCEVGGVYIYKNEIGKTVCSYAYGG